MGRLSRISSFALPLALAVACGLDDASDAGDESDAGDGSAGSGGWASKPDGAAGSAGSTADAASDAPIGPLPDAHDPCGDGACWTAPTVGGTCGTRTLDEDFASGAYNAHRYLVLAPAGVDVDLTLQQTAGSWAPALVVHDDEGVTVFDGETSLSTAALAVTAGPSAGSLRLNAAAGMHVSVYVTDRDVIDGGFQSSVPTSAEYSLEVATKCPAQSQLTVRGVALGTRQELWVRYVATRVVPELRGSETERVDKAAVVTWWSLKEGVLDVNNPLSYSNCSFPPDQHIGPVEICPDPNNAWQVGLSGVQSAWKTLANVEALALDVHPEKSVTDVLIGAAKAAGFGAQTELGQTIATSTDRLRLSWLLRDSAVGFEAQYPIVNSECFVQEKSWCFGTGWPTSASFAPSRAGAEQAVADLKSIFTTLAP